MMRLVLIALISLMSLCMAAPSSPPPFDTSNVGFLTVDAALGNHMFYWFFPAQNNASDAPIVLWLDGGPGVPGTFQVFSGMGPYRLEVESTDPLNMTVLANEFTWNKNFSLLFVDNPVGVGYSYSDSGQQGIPNDQATVGKQLHQFMVQFYLKYPQYKAVPLFVWGESYGGKYVPAAAAALLQDQNIPLRGIGIGDGLVDPIPQMNTWTEFAYSNGLIDSQTKTKFDAEIAAEIARYQSGNYTFSTFYGLCLMMGVGPPAPPCSSGLAPAAFNVDIYDIRTWSPSSTNFVWFGVINNTEVLQWLNVYPHVLQLNPVLGDDFGKSEVDDMVTLLEKGLPVFLYNGQFDWLITAKGMEDWIAASKWSGAAAYTASTRFPYNDSNSTPVGIMKKHANLETAIIIDAGHFATHDQTEVLQRISYDWMSSVLNK